MAMNYLTNSSVTLTLPIGWAWFVFLLLLPHLMLPYFQKSDFICFYRSCVCQEVPALCPKLNEIRQFEIGVCNL